ncbi:MAG: hypothetical protein IJV64_09920 [Oscillospiraceae bacterium]|nr:hypothetical protein [Oscillospiraceae bacterium]
MESYLRGWLREKGMSEKEAEARCGRIGLRQVYEALLGGGQTMPQLALRIGLALGMDAEEVRPLGHPLDKRKWTARLKRGRAGEEPLLLADEIDLREDWYTQIDGAIRQERLDMTALHEAVEAKGLDWISFKRAHEAEIRRAQAKGIKPETVLRHIAPMAEALGVEATALMKDREAQAIAPEPKKEKKRPREKAGRVSIMRVEELRHSANMSREDAGRKWAESAKRELMHKDEPRKLWQMLLWRLIDEPVINEETAERLEYVLGVGRSAFME